jgi:hypothetical protein
LNIKTKAFDVNNFPVRREENKYKKQPLHKNQACKK